MNDIIQSLFERKSVRQYQPRPIEAEQKRLILESALQAPTAGNQNLYSIVDITDEELKKQLAVLCDDQPFIAQAPLALVFLADCRRWYDSYCLAGAAPCPPEEGDLLLAMADALIAAQNTVVAAQALGIGSCYIGDILEQEEELRQALALDDYVFPAAFVVYGYPSKGQQERAKPARPSLEYVVFTNQYRRLSEAEQVQMYLKKGNIKQAEDFESYIKAFCQRKYMADFSLEMRRSAKRYLAHFSGQAD